MRRIKEEHYKNERRNIMRRMNTEQVKVNYFIRRMRKENYA